ncbi:hypothetical protein CEXT_500661 [Caerostris extrusa]|uniref:Uncharacterized protein n=1 Tax=Caerostris extrusa TaxID=172846 RepID=A0AAV4NHJ5_CAEEX|nr:hypothetical protein CEXT_500661 [Caerostris extrusa]
MRGKWTLFGIGLKPGLLPSLKIGCSCNSHTNLKIPKFLCKLSNPITSKPNPKDFNSNPPPGTGCEAPTPLPFSRNSSHASQKSLLRVETPLWRPPKFLSKPSNPITQPNPKDSISNPPPGTGCGTNPLFPSQGIRVMPPRRVSYVQKLHSGGIKMEHSSLYLPMRDCGGVERD